MKQNTKGTWVSWNENLKHEYNTLHTITSENELVEVVKSSEKLRFFGTKQSSANIAAGLDTLIDMNSYNQIIACLLYTSPSPRDGATSRMPSSA